MPTPSLEKDGNKYAVYCFHSGEKTYIGAIDQLLRLTCSFCNSEISIQRDRDYPFHPAARDEMHAVVRTTKEPPQTGA
jgi:hypothetical protein